MFWWKCVFGQGREPEVDGKYYQEMEKETAGQTPAVLCS
jgi:hypothetical protein